MTDPPDGPASARSKIVCWVVFALTTFGVFTFGMWKHGDKTAVAEYTAVATVRHRGNPDTEAAAILSAANLVETLRSVNSLASESDAADFRRCVQVAVSPASTSGEVQTTIACTRESAEISIALTNALANRHADQLRRQWRSAAEQAYRRAGYAVEHRHKLLCEAHQDFERFLHANLQAPPLRQAEAAQTQSAATRPSSPANPAVAVMERRIDELVRRRADMLRTHNDVHPAVRDLERQIETATVELAALPRSPDDSLGDAAEKASDTAPPLLLGAPAIRMEPVVKLTETPAYRERLAAIERADSAVPAAVAQERTAWNRLQADTPIAIRLAGSREVGPNRTFGAGMLIVALLAGWAAALMAGLIAAPLSRRSRATIQSVEQLRQAISAPVIGVVQLPRWS